MSKAQLTENLRARHRVSDIMEKFDKIELLGENRKLEDAKIEITIEDEKQIKPLVNETPTTSNNNNSCSR